MRLTKLGHSCVRLEKDGATLVIDPGSFSEEEAAVGADVVAITHEHPDHLDTDRLRAAAAANPGLRVYAHPSLAPHLLPLGVTHLGVESGDRFEVEGFDVQVHGERHAVIHPDIPVVPNIGFRIDTPTGGVFHPGDAYTVPDDPVGTLLVPLHAPWMKSAELIDYVRAVGARRSVAIHDGLLNENGIAVYGRNLAMTGSDAGYERLSPGESSEV
ncbi:MBL fold metallo-hydrolase [Nocardiopsis ansamitocini]|uniref:MBL fold metallo-hydrolase n=1 Tax=Nocardiopsis ansamitocini TaxID=1670832 RepID=A0A9W6UJX0_9ACTN|nr:MBL fold metallo-hydrolase [Nocardiopsis ansamitocini]GLU48948.1 MBL fold metallo-hydrolase [Nocardiopsis ansamitocini]